MNEIQVRIPGDLARRLIDEIHRPGSRESVVFGFVSHAQTASRDLILLRELVVPPESAFLPSRGHGARWSGAYMVELLNRALDQQLGLFIFHAHPGVRPVTMSDDDLASAGELLPRFQLVLPQRPHGSIVFGVQSVAGAILMPHHDNAVDRFSLRMIEDHEIRTWPLPEATPAEYLLLARQPLTDSPLLRKMLKRTVVAVVGLSGGGSQVASHLAALGVGEIIAIDDQRADQTNCMATPNLGWIDALFGINKVTAAKWRAWVINRHVTFTGVKARVPEARALQALKRADIIIGCVNNLHARSDLNELAWRYCIPYIDIGLRLTTNEHATEDPRPLTGIPGNHFTAIPGGPCLWCSEFLTDSKLEHETGGRGRSYLHDVAERDTLVSPFNGTLASEAAAEVLRLITGLRYHRESRRQYDGFAGTLLELSVTRRGSCPLCKFVLAAGDPIWQQINLTGKSR